MTRPRKNPRASGIRTRDLPLSRRTSYPQGQRGGHISGTLLFYPVTVHWHRANQPWQWAQNDRRHSEQLAVGDRAMCDSYLEMSVWWQGNVWLLSGGTRENVGLGAGQCVTPIWKCRSGGRAMCDSYLAVHGEMSVWGAGQCVTPIWRYTGKCRSGGRAMCDSYLEMSVWGQGNVWLLSGGTRENVGLGAGQCVTLIWKCRSGDRAMCDSYLEMSVWWQGNVWLLSGNVGLGAGQCVTPIWRYTGKCRSGDRAMCDSYLEMSVWWQGNVWLLSGGTRGNVGLGAGQCVTLIWRYTGKCRSGEVLFSGCFVIVNVILSFCKEMCISFKPIPK